MISYARSYIPDIDLKMMVGHRRGDKSVTDDYTHEIQGRAKETAKALDKVFYKVLGRKPIKKAKAKKSITILNLGPIWAHLTFYRAIIHNR